MIHNLSSAAGVIGALRVNVISSFAVEERAGCFNCLPAVMRLLVYLFLRVP